MQDHRHGDHHPLSHASGQLVRITVIDLLRILKPDCLKGFQYFFVAFLFLKIRMKPYDLIHLDTGFFCRI